MPLDKARALSVALSVRFFNGSLAPWPSRVLIGDGMVVLNGSRMGHAIYGLIFSIGLFVLSLLLLVFDKHVMAYVFLVYLLVALFMFPVWSKYFSKDISIVLGDTLRCSGFELKISDIDEFYSIESRGGVVDLVQDFSGFSSGSIDEIWNAHVLKLSSGEFVLLHKGSYGFHAIESAVASYVGKSVIRIYFPSGLSLDEDGVEYLLSLRPKVRQR